MAGTPYSSLFKYELDAEARPKLWDTQLSIYSFTLPLFLSSVLMMNSSCSKYATAFEILQIPDVGLIHRVAKASLLGESKSDDMSGAPRSACPARIDPVLIPLPQLEYHEAELRADISAHHDQKSVHLLKGTDCGQLAPKCGRKRSKIVGSG